MAEQYYFILTALPSLPELSESAPMGLREFRQLACEEASAATMVDAVLLEQDILSREAVGAGEIEQADGIVLTNDQIAGDEPLPEFLTSTVNRQYRITGDSVWEALYRYVHRIGTERKNLFLREWADFEVSLRNALARERAEKLGLDAHAYLVTADVDDAESMADTVSAWAKADDPLSAMRVLDERRREWLEEHSRYFSFAADELLAYARGLVLVNRWQMLEQKEN